VRKGNLAAARAIHILLLTSFLPYLWLREPGLAVWNVVPTLLLVGSMAAIAFLARFFATHSGEIGEARFDTRDTSAVDG
jgi:hypothetical protein